LGGRQSGYSAASGGCQLRRIFSYGRRSQFEPKIGWSAMRQKPSFAIASRDLKTCRSSISSGPQRRS
jgi:hypothetical protein